MWQFFEAPFFLLAHLSSSRFWFGSRRPLGAVPARSFSRGELLSELIGLYFSFKLLKAHFNPRPCLDGNGRPHLSRKQPCCSTAPRMWECRTSTPFFLFASFIYCTPGFLANPSWKNSSIISLLSALIVLIKPNNGILLLYLLLLRCKKSLRGPLDFAFALFQSNFAKNRIWMIVLAATSQSSRSSLYWKTVTGDWIVYSYGFKDEGFNWLGS